MSTEWYRHNVALPEDSYFLSLPIEQVTTTEDIKFFGQVYPFKPFEDVETRVAEFSKDFSRRLDNAARNLLWTLFPVENRAGLPTEPTEGYIEVQVAPEMEEMHTFPEGGLPSPHPAIVRYGGEWTIYVPRDEINVRLLARPMYFELARIGDDRRMFFLAYFNIERKKENR